MPFDDTNHETVTEVPDPRSLTTPKERLAYLRDFLRTLPPEKFDMGEWRCGSTACIGGWADNLFGEEAPESWRMPGYTISESGAAKLGLRGRAQHRMFYTNLSVTDPKLAAYVVDGYLKTGVVSWTVARLRRAFDGDRK